jgi:hypothetical protein
MKEIAIPSFSKGCQSCSCSTVVFMKVVRLAFTCEVEFDCQIDFIYFKTIHFYPSSTPTIHSVANITNVISAPVILSPYIGNFAVFSFNIFKPCASYAIFSLRPLLIIDLVVDGSI